MMPAIRSMRTASIVRSRPNHHKLAAHFSLILAPKRTCRSSSVISAFGGKVDMIRRGYPLMTNQTRETSVELRKYAASLTKLLGAIRSPWRGEVLACLRRRAP
jgi:hypothetical protein